MDQHAGGDHKRVGALGPLRQKQGAYRLIAADDCQGRLAFSRATSRPGKVKNEAAAPNSVLMLTHITSLYIRIAGVPCVRKLRGFVLELATGPRLLLR